MNYPFRQKYCFLYSYYTNLYIAEDKPKEAKKAMQQAFSYVDDTNRNDPFLISVYNLAMARYYFYVKKYPEAIREIDKVLSVDYSTEPLKLKAEILKARIIHPFSWSFTLHHMYYRLIINKERPHFLQFIKPQVSNQEEGRQLHFIIRLPPGLFQQAHPFFKSGRSIPVRLRSIL